MSPFDDISRELSASTQQRYAAGTVPDE